jgi:ribokinase
MQRTGCSQTRGRVLITEGERTGTAIIAVDDARENLIVVDPGANSRLEPRDIAAPLGQPAALLVQLEIPFTVKAAVAASRAMVVLNPAPGRPIEPALLNRVQVLVPNRKIAPTSAMQAAANRHR